MSAPPSSRILVLAGAASTVGGLAAIGVSLAGVPLWIGTAGGAIALLAGVAVFLANRAGQAYYLQSGNAEQKAHAELTRNATEARVIAEQATGEVDRLKSMQTALTLEIDQLKRANELQHEQIRQFVEKRAQRSISSQQKFDIRHGLSAMKGSPVELRLYSSDPEARTFADTVRDTLQLAGLEVTLKTMAGKSGTGFAVVTHQKESVPPLATAISSAFSGSGVRLGLVAEASVPPNTFFIFVGGRKQKAA